MGDVGGPAGGRGGGQAGGEDDVDTGGARAQAGDAVTLERPVMGVPGGGVDNPEPLQSDSSQSEGQGNDQSEAIISHNQSTLSWPENGDTGALRWSRPPYYYPHTSPYCPHLCLRGIC